VPASLEDAALELALAVGAEAEVIIRGATNPVTLILAALGRLSLLARRQARTRWPPSRCRRRRPVRAGPSAKPVVMMDSPAGAVNAALTPSMKRVAISRAPSLARPPRVEATMNTPSEIRNMRRRPSRSAARPPSSKKPP